LNCDVIYPIRSGYYAVQGHSKSPMSHVGTSRKPVCDFLLAAQRPINILTYLLISD